ncbi:hypothetical protein BO70DRAFT_262672, partial [Aspergillus heteromorphus CBS 117.55]
MFNPNIPTPGHRDHHPIVIDDDDENDDILAEEEEEEEEEDEDEEDEELSDSDSDSGMQMEYSIHQRPQPGIMGYEPDRKIRSRLREERHAALCVLLDRELLTIQALAAQETLPQSRRRFLSKLLAPEDPDSAAAIRADRFTVQHPAPSSGSASASTSTGGGGLGSTVPMIVPRRVVDVCETDDAGWRRATTSASRGGS